MPNDPMPSEPTLRHIPAIVEAIDDVLPVMDTVAAEMGFQAKRLYRRLEERGSSEQEGDHLTDLLAGYLVSRRHLLLLKRYLVGWEEKRNLLDRDEGPRSEEHTSELQS